MKGNPQQFVVDAPPRDQPLNVVVAWVVRQFEKLRNVLYGSYLTGDETLAVIGRRNILINGDFSVWQRGNSFPPGHNHYVADRWVFNSSSGTTSFIGRINFGDYQTAAGLGTKNRYGFGVNVTAGNDFMCLYQRVENAHTFAGKKVTLSCVAAATRAGLKSRIYLYRVSQGVGDPEIVISNVVDFPHPGDGLYRRLEWSIDVPLPPASWPVTEEIAAVVLVVDQYTDTSTAPWDLGIFDIQMELGDKATPFEILPTEETLALCQRFYIKSTLVYDGYVLNSASPSPSRGLTVTFPVTMRGTPTVVSRTWVAWVSDIAVNANPYGIRMLVNTTANGSYPSLTGYEVSADV